MFEMGVWPVCLNCRWREFEENEVYGPKGTTYVFECKKAPVCKLMRLRRILKRRGASLRTSPISACMASSSVRICR